MQAIQTKFIPPTNSRGGRIRAACARGTITVPFHNEGDTDPHRYAVECLTRKFCADDLKQYGTPIDGNPWKRPFVSGELPDGTQAHVFLS